MPEINHSKVEFLNIFKAFLVIGMITGHAVMLLSNSKHPMAINYKTYINLISFSGFMFAFGYVYELTLFSRTFVKITSKIKSVLSLYLAFCISGFFYRLLITNKIVSLKMITDILLLLDIPGYSEFLLAFAIIIFLALMIKKIIPDLITKDILVFFLAGLSLLSSIIFQNGTKNHHTGLLIGTHQYGAFPVLQYSFWFWLGILMRRARIKTDFKTWMMSGIFTLCFVIFYVLKNRFPGRFPPTIWWLIGSALPLLILYQLSLQTEKLRIRFINIKEVLSSIGENTLFYLILSNILLFVLHLFLQLPLYYSLVAGLLIIFVLYFLQNQIRR